jgi:hypothetical protein
MVNQSLVAIGKCLTRTPDMRKKLSEKVYEIGCKWRRMSGDMGIRGRVVGD